MKRASWIFVIVMLGFFSCEKEEFITDRGYPFLVTISVSDVDETGATVNFEVKSNNGLIDEYGVEFIETYKVGPNHVDPVFYSISETRSPTPGRLVSVRIDQMLVKNVNYIVRPFAKYKGKVVYGENLLFDSQGVRPPEITNVSDSELTQSHILTITGNYFNPSPEYLDVRIPELEGVYTLEILEHSTTHIKIKVWISGFNYTIPDGRYDLVVISGENSTTLEDFFSVVLPKIESISIVEGFVGQSIDLYLNKLTSLDLLDFRFVLPDMGVYFGRITEVESNRVRLAIDNMPPSDYTLSVEGRGFSNEFSQKFKLKNSWEPFKDKFPIDNLYNWSWVGVGDEMIFWENVGGDFQNLYSLHLNSDEFEVLSGLPESNTFRTNHLVLEAEDKYLYFGLGYLFESQKDFQRFNTQTRKWEKLADFPFESTGVEKAFSFQGKVYIILYSVAEYAIYDTNTNSWSMSSTPVPDDFRLTLYQDSSEEGVYYVPREQSQLIRYVPEVSREVITDLPGYASIGTHFVSIIGRDVFLFHGTYEYFKVNLNTGTVDYLQTLNGMQYLGGRPWATSQGLMLAFPINQHEVDMTIYRWVAGD
jgi:hypothetical protein